MAVSHLEGIAQLEDLDKELFEQLSSNRPVESKATRCWGRLGPARRLERWR